MCNLRRIPFAAFTLCVLSTLGVNANAGTLKSLCWTVFHLSDSPSFVIGIGKPQTTFKSVQNESEANAFLDNLKFHAGFFDSRNRPYPKNKSVDYIGKENVNYYGAQKVWVRKPDTNTDSESELWNIFRSVDLAYNHWHVTELAIVYNDNGVTKVVAASQAITSVTPGNLILTYWKVNKNVEGKDDFYYRDRIFIPFSQILRIKYISTYERA